MVIGNGIVLGLIVGLVILYCPSLLAFLVCAIIFIFTCSVYKGNSSVYLIALFAVLCHSAYYAAKKNAARVAEAEAAKKAKYAQYGMDEDEDNDEYEDEYDDDVKSAVDWYNKGGE